MHTALRDRFFALSSSRAPADEVKRYRAEVDAVDTEATTTIDGLAVCWHPTARFKAVRFVDAEHLDAGVRDLFARPSEAMPYLAAVFVDPREYSFRTFENILPLDEHFEGVPLELTLAEGKRLGPDMHTFALRLPDEARERLEKLDALDLYVPPLNAGQRGGDRFIFHSALLAEALTGAVSAAMPELDGFSHVNPVFRCNRFEPGDANFHRHRDTPYRDAARQQISRYTLLIYLTGGSAAPALDLLDGASLDAIAPFTCVLFDQRYEHEGAPYQDGRKVFLRTELIFNVPKLPADPRIGALFSKACYLTGESVFAPELTRWADDYYNRAAAARWQGQTAGAEREPFRHKEFRGLHFVANGYDFWFPKAGGLTPAECAAVTLLDYFNCKVGGEAFRSLCQTETIEAGDAGWIPDFLAAQESRSVIAPFDKGMLFPEPETAEDEQEGSTRAPEPIEVYEYAQGFAKAHILPAPVLMLGEDVVLDPDRFVIDGDLIHIVGDKPLGHVNFASDDVIYGSWAYVDESIDTATSIGAAEFLVPPILFRETAGCYHLRFDFFRNSWMVKHKQIRVAVPVMAWNSSDGEGQGGGGGDGVGDPWLSHVNDLITGNADDPTELARRNWWVGDIEPVTEVEQFIAHVNGDPDDDEDEDEDDD